MTEALLIGIMVIVLAIFVLAIIIVIKITAAVSGDGDIKAVRQDIIQEQRESRRESMDGIMNMSDMLARSVQGSFDRQDSRMDVLTKGVADNLRAVGESLKNYSVQSEQRLDNIRTTIESRLTSLQNDNNQKLEKMRETVDEKLQKTLDDKLSQSFSMVSERLEQVYKGLGEMQTLAVGVGDLKKVLSNVKTRGILGEIQLGAILEQMMSNEQYDREVVTKQGSRDHVEFAVKLPSDDGSITYLPIDAKFPMDAYSDLVDAYDEADAVKIDLAAKLLMSRIKQEAKDIHEKYIDPPNTTDFAIMFFPIEGLYAEAVRRGMVEILQRDYKVSIAGPTTMAALLNSLQMGFRTLAIQKRSGEVWRVLGAVKNEFDTFAGVLNMTQQRLNQANEELDKLVGVRTRQIQRRLKDVTTAENTEEKLNILTE
ncbi:MAG: DNA recombination protein RmuC [Oscillospiraceae bacterium]